MLVRRYLLLAAIALFFVFQTFTGRAIAVELDPATRTVPLNASGDSTVLTIEQVALGKKLFNETCASCHLSGGTRTNPNVDLSPEALAGAFPARNNIEALVDYMKNPTTYDGFTEIAEVHPATKSADIFPKMKNLSEDDLVAIAGHVLLQPKVNSSRWAGGKSNY